MSKKIVEKTEKEIFDKPKSVKRTKQEKEQVDTKVVKNNTNQSNKEQKVEQIDPVVFEGPVRFLVLRTLHGIELMVPVLSDKPGVAATKEEAEVYYINNVSKKYAGLIVEHKSVMRSMSKDYHYVTR